MKQVLRNKDKGSTLERYYKSFIHALEGIRYAFKYEHNMIIIGICALLVIVAGLAFDISSYEWLFVLVVIGLIAACEMINTSIEATIDLVTTKTHPLAKIAKDTASSATLILSITAFIGALIIFIPRVVTIISNL